MSQERILEAAARIFADKGYAGTTMRDVARQVGLRAGSLYYHYRSKEELIEAVLAQGMRGVSGAVRLAVAAVPAGAPSRQKFNVAVLAHLQSLLEFGVYALASRRVLGQVPAHVRRRHVALQDDYGDFWLRLLEGAQEDGSLRAGVDLHLMRTFVLGALNYALEWYRPQGSSLQDIAGRFCSMIGDGTFRDPRDTD